MTRATAFRPASMVAVALAAAYAGTAQAAATSARGSLLTEIITLGAAIVSVFACRLAARTAGPDRQAWTLLSHAGLLWSAGELARVVVAAGGDALGGVPGAADVGHLAAVPFAIAGLLSFTTAPARLSGQLRVLLDGCVIAGSLLLVSWALVLRAVVAASPPDAVRLVALAYPLCGTVLVTVALTMLARSPRGDRLAMTLVAAGAVTMGMGDGVFALLSLGDGAVAGAPAGLGWTTGYLLLALGALAPQARRRYAEPLPVNGWTVLLPYVPFAVAAAVALGEVLIVGRLDAIEAWALAVVVGLLTLRQFLTSLDNAALARDLATAMVKLAKREEYFRSLVQGSTDVVMICDEQHTLRFCSPAIERIFGHPADDLTGASFVSLVHEDDAARVRRQIDDAIDHPGERTTISCRLRHVDGGYRDIEAVVTNQLGNPVVRGLVFNTRDVSERRELQEQLTHQAFHDPLTGLANRSLFRDRVRHALTLRSRSRAPLAVLFLDLDGFKAINDSLGHSAGDRLLRMTAERLQTCVRPSDTVARLGGDEFAVLLEDLDEATTARQVAGRFLDELRTPFTLDGHEVFVGASIGIAEASLSADADDLLRNADLAMYRAKALGKNRCETYEPAMHAAVVRRLQLESDLRLALAHGHFSLRYQPIVNLDDGELVSVEALVRWEHPTRGTVLPSEFISVAEDSGLIVPIGRWVLAESVRQVRRWHRMTGEWLRLSVNLSARQLQAPRLAENVASVLRGAGMPARQLVLEITESILVDDADRTIAKLHLLRELGVRLAIDDFGTGYSSLSYLRRLPVDVLKIDRSFVTGIGRESDVTALTAAIARLGNQLGLEVVAEGIEEESQLRELRAIGCHHGQGFLFAEPLTAEEMGELLKGRRQMLPPAQAAG